MTNLMTLMWMHVFNLIIIITLFWEVIIKKNGLGLFGLEYN